METIFFHLKVKLTLNIAYNTVKKNSWINNIHVYQISKHDGMIPEYKNTTLEYSGNTLGYDGKTSDIILKG